MSIHAICPACGAVGSVPEPIRQREVRCRCGRTFRHERRQQHWLWPTLLMALVLCGTASILFFRAQRSITSNETPPTIASQAPSPSAKVLAKPTTALVFEAITVHRLIFAPTIVGVFQGTIDPSGLSSLRFETFDRQTGEPRLGMARAFRDSTQDRWSAGGSRPK